MPSYVKSKRGYTKIEFNAREVKKAYEDRKKSKKFPTSISLPEDTVAELKSFAQTKGIPYQTLMRMLIIEGLEKLRDRA
jgi:predicted DNA binding CopG/RHH family protein